MTPADRNDFCQIVLGLAELFGKELSTPALALYWNSMKDWSLEEFRVAAELLLRRSEFLPLPRDFAALRRAARPLAGEAWARVLTHLRGGYRSGAGVDTGGPIDRTVQSLGGYQMLAFRDIQYLGIDERRFVERFSEMVDAIEVRRAIPQLIMSSSASSPAIEQLGDVPAIADGRP